jgi:hypothetical protein
MLDDIKKHFGQPPTNCVPTWTLLNANRKAFKEGLDGCRGPQKGAQLRTFSEGGKTRDAIAKKVLLTSTSALD